MNSTEVFLLQEITSRNLISKQKLHTVQSVGAGGGPYESSLETLVKKGYIEVQALSEILNEALGISWIEHIDIPSNDTQRLMASYPWLQEQGAYPLEETEHALMLAIKDPVNCNIEDSIRAKVKKDIILYAAFPRTIENAWAFQRTQASNITLKATQTFISDFVHLLIEDAVDKRATDIHFEPFRERFRIRFRIDGVLQEIKPIELDHHAAITSHLKIMARMDIAEKRVPQDGKIKYTMGRDILDIRVSSIPSLWGESLVLRLLPTQSGEVSLLKLGMLEDHLVISKRWLRSPSGLILITGPTGSGKTTTLYAFLKSLDRHQQKIITIEDPIEYNMLGINQVAVNPAIGLTFEQALRSILRQAPNTIMIGEIRDQETAKIAVNASITGHLVLSTLHTQDASNAVIRLLDMGVQRFLLASALKGVIAQRLVRRNCNTCKVSYYPTYEGPIPISNQWFKGFGCSSCGHTGFSGRFGIFEFLEFHPQLQAMIHEGVTTKQWEKALLKYPYRMLQYDGVLKAAQGWTTLEEVFASI